MEDKMLYKDPSQPVDVRVEDLLSRMTLEEKAAQLCGDLAASFIVDGKLSHEALKEKFKDGHGRITQYLKKEKAEAFSFFRFIQELQFPQ